MLKKGNNAKIKYRYCFHVELVDNVSNFGIAVL